MGKYVIYIGTIFFPDKNAASQRATMICKSYRDNGKIPIMIGVSKDNVNNNILETFEIHNGFDTYEMPYPKSNIDWIKRLYDIGPILKIIDKYGAQNIHSIIIMDYMFVALWRLMRYASKKNIRIVVDTVDWFNKSEYRFPKNIVKDLDTFFRMRYIHKKSQYMIAISKYLFNYYKNNVENIVMIPGTVDMNDEKWKEIEPYQGNNILTLGYAGDPGKKFERERLDWLIRIVAELNQKGKRISLIMAGVEKETIKKNKPELFELDGLEGNIFFLGKIPHKNCLNMISTCDFSVIIRENILVNRAGFPTKLSESFACSTPVISTPTSNISDYITNGVNGFLTEDFTFDSIKNVIEKIVNLDKETIYKIHENTKTVNALKYEYFNDKIKCLID